MTIDIQPIEIGGQLWVRVSMDGEMKQHGPYDSADTAEIIAIRLAAMCRAMNAEVTMAAPAKSRP